MSTPFCVSGRAAMKMTISTSSTSMSGVMFMSALACGTSPLTTLSAPRCGVRAPLLASRRSAQSLLRVRNQADVLDARLTKLVHRRHDGAVFHLLIGLDEDDLLLRILEELGDLRRQLGFLHRFSVHVHRLVL